MNQKSNPTGSASTEISKKDSIVDDAKQALGRVADQAKDQASMRVSSQKERAVDTIDGVADAIRKTSHGLKDAGPIPDLADRAADGIEALAGYVKNKNIGDLVGEVESFARREPALFLGGAFALGLLGGSFLKSSTSSGTGGGSRSGYEAYDRSYGYGYGRGYEGNFADDDYGFARDDYAGRSFGGVADSSDYGSSGGASDFGTTTAPMPATQAGTGTASGLGGSSLGGSDVKPGTGSSFGGGNTGSV